MAVDGDLKKRGPYIFKIPYTISSYTHEATFQCVVDGVAEPGSLPIDINLRTRNGVGRTLADAAATFWAIARFFVPTGAIVAQYYLERAEAGTDKLFYVSAGELFGAPAGGAYTPYRQMTQTYRTALSSVARLVFFETAAFASDDLTPLLASTAGADNVQHMAFWATDGLSPMLGVDGSWLVAPMTVAYTQNEAIYNSRARVG